MASGGPRPGSGRPKGVQAKKTSAAIPPTARSKVVEKMVERVAGIDLSPLEVMLDDMKLRYDMSKRALANHEREKDPERASLIMDAALSHSSAAVESAAKVAPYIHAKLQTTTLKGDTNSPIEIALGLYDAATLRAAVRGNK